MAATATTGRPPALASAAAALVDAGLVLLAFVLPHEIAGDSAVRFAALRQLLEQHTISRTEYSLVQPLAAAPFYLAGKFLFTPDWWCARFNIALFAIALTAARALVRAEEDRRLLRTMSLVLVAASMFPRYLTGFDTEVFTAVLVAVGVLAVQHGRGLAGWMAIVIGVVNTPAAIVGLVFVVVVHGWQRRGWRHAIAVPAAVALVLAESWIRRGSPWVSGYEHNAGYRTVMPYSGLAGFSYPLFFGLLSILFSFGKGLVFFAPGLWVRIRREELGDALFGAYTRWLAFLAGLILVYAKWWSWYGGMSWGPRFFLFASAPAALAIAVRIHRSRDSLARASIALAALALSTWVAIDGVSFGLQGLDLCSQHEYALEFACWYVPEFSPLWRPFVLGLWPNDRTALFAVYCLIACATMAAPLARHAVAGAVEQWRAR
jgi:hypothetical protein